MVAYQNACEAVIAADDVVLDSSVDSGVEAQSPIRTILVFYWFEVATCR